MIVDCALYRDGKRAAPVGDLSDALAMARRDGAAFIWIGLYEPDAAELDRVSAELGLHPLAVEDAVKAHQRPKVEDYEDSLFVVLKTVSYDDATSSISIGEVMLFVGDSFVVSVRHGEAKALSDVRHRLENEPTLAQCGPSAVLYAAADRIVDDYTQVALELEQDIDDVEEAVFAHGGGADAERIYKLKREVIEFRRAVRPLVEPMKSLAAGMVPNIHKEMQHFLRDVADHIARVVDQIDNFDELLTSVLNANLAQVQVRQNNDMRRISAWVAIVAVPTMIAGIYGMNFDHMPELHWRYGYPMAVALMAGFCVALYRAFKRSGWL
ncbi:MAG: magnesium/cobalt transporter CorA [Sporichthyaceae bacterium]